MGREVKECPCGSLKPYAECCQRFHEGRSLPTPVELMRSRYAAYALNLPQYIMATTHPGSPHFIEDRQKWTRHLAEFALNTKFSGVEILSVHEEDAMAVIVFTARLTQKKQDLTFTEKSYFEKVRGKWLYRNGLMQSGHAPNLITTAQLRPLPLAYFGNPVLRAKTEKIEEITEDIKRLALEMVETMDACDGVGIAAPQVHHSIRLFVIRAPIEHADGHIDLGAVKVFINPTLHPVGSKTQKKPEGCLSIPGIHADVERPYEVEVEYMDLEGRKIKARFVGEEARYVSHEYDHIEGILFTDRLDEKKKQALEPFLQRMNKRIHDGTDL